MKKIVFAIFLMIVTSLNAMSYAWATTDLSNGHSIAITAEWSGPTDYFIEQCCEQDERSNLGSSQSCPLDCKYLHVETADRFQSVSADIELRSFTLSVVKNMAHVFRPPIA